MFSIEKGKGKYFINLEQGETPLISARNFDNGIIGYVNLQPTFKAPAITIERVTGTAFVQLHDFATVPDDIFVLVSFESQPLEFLIFVAGIINKHKWRYNYSRKVTSTRIGNTLIQLPTDLGNSVDIDIIRKLVGNCYGSEILYK